MDTLYIKYLTLKVKPLPKKNDNIHPLMTRVESVQYEAACVVLGAWRGCSRKYIYIDLGWESLYHRRNLRRLCIFYDVLKKQFPKYLSCNIDTCKPKRSFRLLEQNKLTNWPCRTNKFNQSFFPSTIKYWNALEDDIKNAANTNIFKNLLLKKIRPKCKKYFGILDKTGTRFITLLRLGLSPLCKHKFDHNFNDTPNPTCPSGDGVESTNHYLLLCKSYKSIRTTLLRNVTEILKENINNYPNKKKIKILLYGSSKLPDEENKKILKESINYIIKTKRFENLPI